MSHPILVPVDVEYETSWRPAMTAAREEALRRGAEVHLLSVLPDFGMSLVAQYFPEGYSEKMTADAKAQLDTLGHEMLGSAVVWQAHAHHGDIVKTIMRYAEQMHAGLIVMAAHSPGERSFLSGTHADHVVHQAACSVLVVRGSNA
ncbi:MAG: universal stress protein [Pseudomonadota bacterium]